MPTIIPILDKHVKDHEFEIWIVMLSKDGFDSTCYCFERYFHERSTPIELHASDVISFENHNINEMKRTDYQVKKGRCFGISNFLTSQECSKIINLCEELKFKTIDWEYCPSYRNCTRLCKKIYLK